jgi:F1F0 ATPase subunit 2
MSMARLPELLTDGALFVVLGALIGAGYFPALRFNVRHYLSGGSLGPAIAFHLGRLLLAGIGFALIAPAGAVPSLGALCGFVLARAVALQSARS